MIWTKQELAHFSIDAAEKAGVPPAMVCAIIEVSSSWNVGMREWEPPQWLLANHPNDFRGGEVEYLALGTRWGLMQFMGWRLKDVGWKGPLSPELGEPQMNLEAGCTILKSLINSGSKNVLIHWYGLERRRMADITSALVPTFERFVSERPKVERAPSGQSPTLPSSL